MSLLRCSIGNAKIAGLQKDLHLSSGQYSLSLIVFFITYVIFEVPSKWVGCIFEFLTLAPIEYLVCCSPSRSRLSTFRSSWPFGALRRVACQPLRTTNSLSLCESWSASWRPGSLLVCYWSSLRGIKDLNNPSGMPYTYRPPSCPVPLAVYSQAPSPRI